MKENEMKFYEQPLLTWGLLFIYPPLGILFLWLIGHYDLMIRIALSFLFGLIFLEFLGFYSSFVRAALYTLIFFYLIYRYQKIKSYEEQITMIYDDALEDHKIQLIFHNYLNKFEPPTTHYERLLNFELFIRQQYPYSYTHLTLSHLEETYINIIYKPSPIIVSQEESTEVISEDKFINSYHELKHLSDLISEELKIKGERFRIYFTLQLLKAFSVSYYGDSFYKQYQQAFTPDIINNLDQACLQYVSIDALDNDLNSKDLAFFTYYLMLKGTLKKASDFYENILKVHHKLQDAKEERQKIIFKKHLFSVNDDLIKEIEPVKQAKTMNDKERFTIYIIELLTELGYHNIRVPRDGYLDLIMEQHHLTVGVNMVYHTELEKAKNVSIKTIQDMKLGLVYHKIEKGIIITDKTFTQDAVELAVKNDIMLWDESVLKEKTAIVKRYQESNHEKPKHEINFSDISYVPFEQITISHIEKMSGSEFQYFVAEIFKRKGYQIIEIFQTRDKGIDIILQKNSLRFGVQAKRSKTNIGRDAIKEIVAGIPYYNLNYGYMATDSRFTEEAIMLADLCGIKRFNKEDIISEIENFRR